MAAGEGGRGCAAAGLLVVAAGRLLRQAAVTKCKPATPPRLARVGNTRRCAARRERGALAPRGRWRGVWRDGRLDPPRVRGTSDSPDGAAADMELDYST